MAEKYSIVCMYQSFFIHSSVDEYLGCFHVLAIVNSVAVNTEVHISFPTMFFPGCMKQTYGYQGALRWER